ncbi:MAG: aminopeptidase [Gemmatimonadota bacterium]|nr:aminopeptidase [Gemmatimonadota bacterium]MDH3421408.1 aminopeptidase [Gemmatimonadota bacterium]
MTPRFPRRWVRAVLALSVLSLAASCLACSPVYVVKAGIAEVDILRARRPIPEVLSDPLTDEDTRAKLTYIVYARRFAAEELDIDVGDAYTMFTQLNRDTLALVVSAAPKDQMAPVTWWFPIVGRVPYRGYFSEDDAMKAAADLAEEGYDTYVRPTAAFSTLGWFNDPVLSTMLRTDDIEVVQTVLHELAHRYMFVPGHVGFNEAFANFVGRVATIQFFCTREGGGPDTVKCLRAQARWRDFQRFSVFMDEFTAVLERLYFDQNVSVEEKVVRREPIFAEALSRFENEVMPTFESITFSSFITTPLNNATLMGRVRYYNRLPDFQALLDAHEGNLTSTMEALRRGVTEVDDPWDLIPRGAALLP